MDKSTPIASGTATFPARATAAAHVRRLGQVMVAIAFAFATLAVTNSECRAGLAASEVVVIVNGQSFNSRTLANHYVALRSIPASNVIVLEGIPNSDSISVDQFRDQILQPILAAIAGRGLGHIQCVAYSADFPTTVDIAADLKPLGKLEKIYAPKASLTSLTYFFETVRRGIPSYIQMDANYYARSKIDDLFSNPAGSESIEQWNTLQKLIQQRKHSEASQLAETLFDASALKAGSSDEQSLPSVQFPMAYLASAQAALAQEEDRAVELLQKAIDAGWTAGGYLARDESFDGIRDLAEFQVLEYQLAGEETEYKPSRGFSAYQFWTPNGVPLPRHSRSSSIGQRFLLSIMLGVTRGKGTTLPEAMDYLKRSATADFSHPEGVFLFSLTKDVRTTTRRWGFLAAIDHLKRMGHDAEIIPTSLPKSQKNIIGFQMGTPNFRWASSNSAFVPGGIADNLTSYGGIMTPGSSQTKLTELLKAGAAGSTGTVVEPYALQAKFPLPMLYVHYARGCTLAESFYQSVSGPYQLLLVGDPLCQPFSHGPKQAIDRSLRYLTPDESFDIPFEDDLQSYDDWLNDERPEIEKSDPIAANQLSLLINGRNQQTKPSGNALTLNSKGLPRGFHELTLRLSNSNDPLLQKYETSLPLWVGDQKLLQVEVAGKSPKRNESDGRLFAVVSLRDEIVELNVECSEQPEKLELWNHAELLTETKGDTDMISLDLTKTGRGPLRLSVKAVLANQEEVRSQPIWLRVDP